ncbi:MAG: carboxy-S-adenosyl-L-methionine synthase CmoA [Pseudomonadales bacterium]
MTNPEDTDIEDTDRIYSSPQETVQPFEFNHSVAAVFDDMINRSVPGYGLNIDLISLLASRYAQTGSHLYDLGCSSGRATLALAEASPDTCRIIGVDNSVAMIDVCSTAIEAHPHEDRIELRCEDLLETPVHDASMIVLNYTLQFLALSVRGPLIQRLYSALKPSGVLFIAEKISDTVPHQQTALDDLHLDFKRRTGYSELEIAQKRAALERVLIPESESEHLDRLRDAGFETVATLSKAINFCGFIGIKAGHPR